MRGSLMAMALLLGSTTAHAAAPDLRACPPLKPQETSERQRSKPLSVPRALARLMRADRDRYAISTLGGGTVCIDTREMEDTQEDHALSADQRFLSFTWSGYETGGYMLVDRSGVGQAVETGAAPSFSPSGKRLASVEWSESGFGTLNGFTVWQVEPVGLKTLVRLEDIPGMAGWRIDRWAGEDCIELSGVPLDKASDDPRDIDSASRAKFAAREVGNRAGDIRWALMPSPRGCALR